MLITTHYMDEAHALCDRVGIMDHGRLIALGTPACAGRRPGRRARDRVCGRRSARAAGRRRCCGRCPASATSATKRTPCRSATSEVHRAVPALLDALRAATGDLSLLTTHSATLEDVFVVTDRDAHLRRCLAIRSFELTMARFREFLREPEAVFWVVRLPDHHDLRAGHRVSIERATQPVIVGVVQAAASAATDRCARGGGWIHGPANRAGRDRARRARRPRRGRGRSRATPPAYHFDEARAESQAARLAVDAALQQAAGRTDVVRRRAAAGRTRRLALHRLARARAARHGHHEHRPVGGRLLDRERPHQEAAEAAGRDADVDARTTWPRTCSAVWCFWRSKPSVLIGFGWLAFGVAVRGSTRRAGGDSAVSARCRSAGWRCSSAAGRGRSRRSRAC